MTVIYQQHTVLTHRSVLTFVCPCWPYDIYAPPNNRVHLQPALHCGSSRQRLLSLMSLSEALGSFPVIRHFYPIDPETSSQQQSLVLNSPSAPVVAPISSFSYPQPRELKSSKQSKRIHEEDEKEVEGLISNSTFRQRKRVKKDDVLENYEVVTSAIVLPPKTQRRQAYVEISVPKSFVPTLYRPMSNKDMPSKRPSGLLSQKRTVPSRLPVASSDSDSDDHSDIPYGRKVRREKAKTRHVIVVQGASHDEDDGSTCHQCRRKTANVKMRCRNVRASGDVCTLLFCEGCIENRYDEAFDPSHLSWTCPRCRGTCNCSLCLRKAGLGYILDALSEQFPGARGRLSAGKSRQLEQISMREWLARRGLMLGTDEWIETQRQRGVRYFVGTSPPSPNGVSPYKEMRLNPTLLVAFDREQEHPGATLDSQQAGRSGIPTDGAPFSVNAGDSACLTPSTAEVGTGQLPANANQATSSMSPDLRPPPITLTKDVSPTPTDVDLPALYGDTEDLPGLTPEQTRHLRLIVGSPLPPRLRKKYHSLPPHFEPYGDPLSEKPKVMGTKRPVEFDDDSDYAPSGKAEPTNQPSALNIHNEPVNTSLDFDETKSSCGSFGSTHDEVFEETRASSPPPEPVFVPTEHYAPSKLDLSHVKDPDAGIGSSLWTLDSYGAESIAGPQSHVLLYAASDDAEISPSHTEVTAVSAHRSVSTSATRTPGDYLTGDTRYPAGDLSSFEVLNEAWIPSEGPVMEGEMPPLRLEHLFSDAD